MLRVLVAGEMAANPARSFKLAPCDAETGFGAAICEFEVAEGFETGGKESPGAIGFDVGGGFGVADWKSSKSSSSAPPDCNPPKLSSIELDKALLPFMAKSLGGVLGGRSSSSNPSISTSGSFGLGGSTSLVSRFTAADIDSGFRRPEAVTAPSSYSSYSSNRSLRLLES